jgi:hypothetical protein
MACINDWNGKWRLVSWIAKILRMSYGATMANLFFSRKDNIPLRIPRTPLGSMTKKAKHNHKGM